MLGALAVVSLAALLTVGATTASAHKGPGIGFGGTRLSTLIGEAAKNLDVTSAKLKDAIRAGAVSEIDDAVADGEIEAADAAALKEQVADQLDVAFAVSRTRGVAASLGSTARKVNDAFRAARRSLAVARIDQALKDGRLDADEAAELKQDVADAKIPGYKDGLLGRGGFGFGLKPFGFGFRGP